MKTALLIFQALLLISCGDPYDVSKDKRAELAKEGSGDVVVAVVWPELDPPLLYPEGVALAVREINENGGVLGRTLRTVSFTDTDTPGGYFDARKVADSPDIVAVVGHFHSDSTLSALITYEYDGIVLLIAAATNPVLLEQGFQYVFRTIPNDAVYAEQIARYASKAGYARIAVIDNGTFYGKGLAEIFYQKATDLGLQVVVHRGYASWQEDFRPMIAPLQEMEFDALFLAGVLPRAGIFVKQLRQMGIDVPILAGDGLDSEELITLAGKAANGVVVPTLFRLDASDSLYQAFRETFRKAYDQAPDPYAILGYDTMKLLAAAMEEGESSVPLVVATSLQHSHGWKGILGDYTFSTNGELTDRTIYFKQVQDGRFIYLEE